MAITNEQLEGLGIEEIKKSLIEYSVALDQANTAYSDTTVKLENAMGELASAQEKIQKLESASGTSEESFQIELSKAQDEIKNLNGSLKKNDEALNKSKKELEKINKVLEKSQKENGALIADLSDLKNKNKDLTKEIRVKDAELAKISKITEQPIVKQTTPEKIYTYNIKGYDNRTGRKIHGGPEYQKAVAVVKYNSIEGVLNWTLISADLDLNLVKSKILTEEELEKIRISGKMIPLFSVIKKFMGIPDYVEDKFDESITLIKG